jgi:uncharacterized membrane protein
LKDRSALALAGLLLVTGVLHFAIPDMYDEIVPGLLPMSDRFWTLASGIAEIVVGLLVLRTPTRAIGALATALLFVAVFPANVKMAIDWSDRPEAEFAIALLRLPLQIPLIWWALRVWRRYRREPIPAG